MKFLFVMLLVAAGCKAKADAPENKGEKTVENKNGKKAPPDLRRHGLANGEPLSPDKATPSKDAKELGGGAFGATLSPGTGEATPGDNDAIRVHYKRWKSDGTMQRSTYKYKRPQTLMMATVPSRWQNLIKGMKVGEKRMGWFPSQRPGVPPGIVSPGSDKTSPAQEYSVMEMELIEIIPAPETPSMKPEKGAKNGKGGLKYLVLQKGTGKTKPNSYDQATFEMLTWDNAGKLRYNTKARGNPMRIPISKLPEGVSDSLQGMVVGEKRRLWVPAALAKSPMFPKGDLVTEIELLDIKEGTPPPKTPADVAKPPKDAKKSEKGVFYKVLTSKKDGKSPTADDKVRVHYSGWTTDGKMFDSSVTRGKPAEFRLRGVIAGWTDGLQLMKVGEKFRFWIPQELAYKGQPGKPAGMLVFDVELLEIK